MMMFPLAILDAFTMVRNHLQKAEVSNSQLIRAIEDLPSSGKIHQCAPEVLGRIAIFSPWSLISHFCGICHWSIRYSSEIRYY